MLILMSALAGLPVAAQQPVAEAGPTLAAVRERGHLICATSDPLPGFAQIGAEGRWTGFDVDFCRAVAVAIFGDPGRMEFVPLSGGSRLREVIISTVSGFRIRAPFNSPLLSSI